MDVVINLINDGLAALVVLVAQVIGCIAVDGDGDVPVIAAHVGDARPRHGILIRLTFIGDPHLACHRRVLDDAVAVYNSNSGRFRRLVPYVVVVVQAFSRPQVGYLIVVRRNSVLTLFYSEGGFKNNTVPCNVNGAAASVTVLGQDDFDFIRDLCTTGTTFTSILVVFMILHVRSCITTFCRALLPVLRLVIAPLFAIRVLPCCLQFYRLCRTAYLLAFSASASCGVRIVLAIRLLIVLNCTCKSY